MRRRSTSAIGKEARVVAPLAALGSRTAQDLLARPSTYVRIYATSCAICAVRPRAGMQRFVARVATARA